MTSSTPPDHELVTVVIPVYNQIATLLRAIQSVQTQTYPHWEAWIVDDGSDCEIASVIQQMGDSRIHYLRLSRHQNANIARNAGILHAKGQYIAMLDSDDEGLAEHLEKSYQCLKKHQADCIYGSLIIDHIACQQTITVHPIGKEETTIDYLLRNGYRAQTSTLFMTTPSARTILWDPSLNRHQDYDFIVRYTPKYRLQALTEATVIYHLTPKNYTIDYSSCMRVIQANKKDISPQLYNSYHQRIYKSIRLSTTQAPEVVHYYRPDSWRYKRYISYSQYLEFQRPQSVIGKFRCFIHYLLGFLTNR